jgi:hypothetical protein
MEQDQSAVPPTPLISGPYPQSYVAGAAVATFMAPFISVVVASVLLGSEQAPARQRQLRTWRNASAAWLAVYALFVVILFSAVLNAFDNGVPGSSGACRGGIDDFDWTGTSYTSIDGKHWTAVYPCVDGGSTTVPVAASAVPGGGETSP